MSQNNPTANSGSVNNLVDKICEVILDKYEEEDIENDPELDKRLEAATKGVEILGEVVKSLLAAGPALTRIADALEKNNVLMQQAVNPQTQVNQ